MLFACGSSFGMMTGVGIVRILSVSFSDSLSDIYIPNLVAPPLLSFFLVLRMPAFGFFILNFGVAGDGARFFCEGLCRGKFLGMLHDALPISFAPGRPMTTPHSTTNWWAPHLSMTQISFANIWTHLQKLQNSEWRSQKQAYAAPGRNSEAEEQPS